MGRSERITLGDVRRVFELLDDLKHSGSQPADWRRHMSERLRELIGSQVSVSCLIPTPSEGSRLVLRDPVDVGYPTKLARSVFQDWADRSDFTRDPTMARIEPYVVAGRAVSISRPQLQDDRSWYRSFHYNEVRRLTTMDDFIRSYRPLPGAPYGTWLSLAREASDGPFKRRDRKIVRLFHLELNRALADCERKRQESSPLHDLPPRLRQTAELLLSGLVEKQIAARLGLSSHSVHEYVKRLYKRLNVTSRAELAARLAPALFDSRRSWRYPTETL